AARRSAPAPGHRSPGAQGLSAAVALGGAPLHDDGGPEWANPVGDTRDGPTRRASRASTPRNSRVKGTNPLGDSNPCVANISSEPYALGISDPAPTEVALGPMVLAKPRCNLSRHSAWSR